jgi:membrane-associated protease RseP (regulator of RpoE activity)
MHSLSESQQARLPSEIDRSNEAYVARIRSVFDHHPPREGREFENFLQVQLLWDETMAERTADWLRANPEGHMVVLAGIGHLIYGQGIPDRVQRRLPVSSAVILNMNQAGELDPGLGDYLVVTPQNDLPPAGKLGVFLDLDEAPPKVSGFAEASGAAKAGVESGDRVVAIDGTPINSYSDIRIALMDKGVGDQVELEVARERLLLDTLNKRFTVTLN